MKNWMKIAAAVALAVPVVTLADDVKKDGEKPERGQAEVNFDDRTNPVILTERDKAGDVVVRVEKLTEETRAELEKLRARLGEEAKRELDRAMKEVERAKEMGAREMERAKAQAAAAREQAMKLKDAHAADVAARLRVVGKRPMPGKAATEKAPFLGVGASPADDALREQLNLPRGVGLVVQGVEEGSPAAEAGIKRFDVLYKLNDQMLVNTHQLAVLVRSVKPGEQVNLTLYRGGKEQTVKAKLVEKEVPVMGGADVFGWEAPPIPPMPRMDFSDMLVKLKDANAHAGVISRSIASDGKRVVVQGDGNLGIALTNENGKRQLKVTDGKTGNVLFEGPIDTEEDRAKMPEEVRSRIRIIDGDGLKWGPDVRLRLDGKVDGEFRGFKGFPGGEFRRDFRFEINRDVKEKDGERKESDFRAMEWSEDGLKLRIEKRDGKKTLSATDQEGKEIFSGPIDTEEQRKKMPESVREKLDDSKWQSIRQKLDE